METGRKIEKPRRRWMVKYSRIDQDVQCQVWEHIEVEGETASGMWPTEWRRVRCDRKPVWWRKKGIWRSGMYCATHKMELEGTADFGIGNDGWEKIELVIVKRKD